MSEHEREGRGGLREGLVQFTRLACRKFIYRRADFVECGAPVRDHREPAVPTTLTSDLVGPDGYDAVLTASPHLAQKDITYFRTVDARLVVFRDGTEIVAMNWFVRGPGEVWISELRRAVSLGPGDHYSCRTFVDPAYRGQALSAHMKCLYAADLDPDERIWAIVMFRNRWSLHSLSELGWQATGSWSVRVVFGRFSARHHAHGRRPLAA